MNYKIVWTRKARAMLEGIQSDHRRTIVSRIRHLQKDPEEQGTPLGGELEGLRSIHVAGRYRAIYKVDRGRVIVFILAVGIRKEGDKDDIYELASKLLRNFLSRK